MSERVGICQGCGEWTSIEDPCCGRPVLYEGDWVMPEEQEETGTV